MLHRKSRELEYMETRLASPELGGNSEDLQRHYQKKASGRDRNEPNKGMVCKSVRYKKWDLVGRSGI